MLDMGRATDILADSYLVPRTHLRGICNDMSATGMLPDIHGPKAVFANPARLSLLLIGLGVSDPERINDLADMLIFQRIPGDDKTGVTLAETLGYMIKGLMDQPGKGIDATLSLTLDGSPVGFIQRQSEMWMQFSSGSLIKGYVNGITNIALQPLTAFCDAARVTQPPFKVT